MVPPCRCFVVAAAIDGIVVVSGGVVVDLGMVDAASVVAVGSESVLIQNSILLPM